jgi:hypothetical protein
MSRLWGSPLKIRHGRREGTIGYERALERMREGATLTLMYDQKAPGGFQHFIVPGGKVDVETAEKLKGHASVVVDSSGLFPGNPQAWRMQSFVEASS